MRRALIERITEPPVFHQRAMVLTPRVRSEIRPRSVSFVDLAAPGRDAAVKERWDGDGSP